MHLCGDLRGAHRDSSGRHERLGRNGNNTLHGYWFSHFFLSLVGIDNGLRSACFGRLAPRARFAPLKIACFVEHFRFSSVCRLGRNPAY